MTAQDVINLAVSAELKQLSVKEDTDVVLGFINLGILELYKRFPLEEAEAIVWLTDGKATYKLDGTDPDVDMNTDKELLLISRVYSEDSKTIELNDEDNLVGVYTPTYNTIEVPFIIQDEYLSVIYRVTPKFLTSINDTVPIPPQLLEALLNYIGYRGHGSVSGELKAENQSHYLRFENSCNRAIMEGLIQAEKIPSKKFEQRGFV